MKRLKTVLGLVLSLITTCSFAQGLIDFGNSFGATVFRAPISGLVPTDVGLSISGQGPGPLYFPTGTTSYQGATFLSGAGYSMALYAGPASIMDTDQLVFIAMVPFRTGGAAGFIPPTRVVIPGVDAGLACKFQVRVWDNVGSTVTWDTAYLRSAGDMVLSDPLGGTDANGIVFSTIPGTTGWSVFNLFYVPEPSTIVLAGLGAASLLLFRCRK